MSTLVLFVVALAALLPFLIRDLKRAGHRSWLRQQPSYRNIKRSFEALQITVGAAMLPAAVRAAADMERSMRKMQDAMAVTPDAFDALKRMADEMRRDTA